MKKYWYDSPLKIPTNNKPPGLLALIKQSNKENRGNNMRIKTLNVVLYKALTGLLNTPEVSNEIYEHQIELSKVSLSEDFTVCRAYWLGSGNKDTDAEIEKLLQKYAPSFRHHMISHHVIGKVPPIVFVRDKEDAKRQEVEELLSLLQSEMKNDLSVEDDGVSRTLDFEYRTEDPTVQTPSMFGIDHTELDHQISEYKKKMKDAPIETDSNELRQQQQEQLAEIRKWDMERKKLKKIKKSKFSRESPKDYLLASEIEEEESDSEQWEDRMECEEEEGVSDSTPK
ncbi:putative ribosome-binding factor A, mitochondrial isoform X3 [Hyperolius riggenbachi]|uniref:putative ribosome-binding factor A, mitochondrial isoform X3 n=1 Tax=Hyperolius riggenbachi TaxID=752182 RepID=UPI0035A3A2E7